MNRLKQFMHLALTLYFSGCVMLMSAQPEKLRSDVRAMFASDTKDLWINQLSGHLDGVHVLDMVIGTDGKQCKGKYTLRSSNTSFIFEGEDTGEQLRLIELTDTGLFCGYILGNYDGKNLNAVWMDVKKIQKIPLTARVNATYDTHDAISCDAARWISRYEGRIDNEKVSLIVLNDKDHVTLNWITGGLFFSDAFAMTGTQSLFPDINFAGTVLANKKLNLNSIANKSATDKGAEIISGNQVQRLSTSASLEFDCFEFADFTTLMELVKPNPGKQKFNTWLEQNFKTWFSEIQKRKSHKPDEDYSTTERWAYNVTGWVEVDLYNQDLLSGTVYTQIPKDKKVYKHAFIYDLGNGKEIKFADIFDKNFNFTDFIKKTIKAKKKELTVPAVMRKWIDEQDFMNISLKYQGLSCRTNFHTVYGEHEIIIPYKDISDKIKLRVLLKEINQD